MLLTSISALSEYLEEWEFCSKDYGLSNDDKVLRLPNYCAPDVNSVVKLFNLFLSPTNRNFAFIINILVLPAL